MTQAVAAGARQPQPAPAERRRPSVLAITSQPPWPLDRGGHLRTFHLLRSLARSGTVRVVAAVPPGENAAAAIAALARAGISFVPALVQTRRWSREVLRAAGARMRCEPYVLYRRHRHSAVQAVVRRACDAEPPDLLYLDHLDSFQYAPAPRQVPVLLDLHNVYSQLVQRSAHDTASRLLGRYLKGEAARLRGVEQRAVAAADIVVAVSEADACQYRLLGAPAVHVVPNGVDCAAYAHLPVGRAAGPPIILCLGALSWPPNASAARFLATVVLPQLRVRIPGVRLRIIGADPPRDVRDLQALPGVEIHGRVADTMPHLRAASVLAVALEAGGGTRLKILEAFAAGLPVVSTAVGCEGLEAVHGLHLIVAEREQFADRLAAVLREPAQATGLAIAARRLAQRHYDWRVVGERLGALVTHALPDRSPVRRQAVPGRLTGNRRPLRILELRSVWGTGGGPDKTILLGAAQSYRRRFDVRVCYIRDRRDPIFGIATQAHSLGAHYIEIAERHSFDPRIWPQLRAVVRAHAIDIVHAHDYKTDLLAFGLARAEGVMPLATAHGWTGRHLRHRLYRALDQRLLARFPLVIAVSRPIAAALIRAGARPERVRTIPNGIDHRRIQRDPTRHAVIRAALGIAPQARVIGAVGRLDAGKRFDLLIHALALLRPARPELQLILAGNGPAYHSLLSLAEQLGVQSDCQLLGQRRDIGDLHHAFDVFVQSSDQEGSPNVVLEAMAFETPIVATDVGGTCELVEDGVHALLVAPGDAAALAAAIARTLDDPAAARRRTVAARARVEREHSFVARMRAVEAVYEQLMVRHGEWPGRSGA